MKKNDKSKDKKGKKYTKPKLKKHGNITPVVTAQPYY